MDSVHFLVASFSKLTIRIFYGIFCRECAFIFGVRSNFSIQVLNKVGGMDNFSNFYWELKEYGQFSPMTLRRMYRIRIFVIPIF